MNFLDELGNRESEARLYTSEKADTEKKNNIRLNSVVELTELYDPQQTRSLVDGSWP